MKRKEIALNRGHSYPYLSKKALLPVNAILVLFFILVFSEGKAAADIYQYKDKNGHWVLTDSPPDNVEKMEIRKDKDARSSRSSGFRDIEKDLTEKYRPKSEIEMASLSTVTIKTSKTSIGLGSGFFINENAYILTNKHVLRGDDTQIKKTEEIIARVDNRIEDDEAAIANAENQLRRMRSDLDDYKASIDRMTNPNAQTIAMQKYRSQSAQYDFYEAQFRKRKNKFEEKISKYRQEKGEFTKKARMAKYDSQFIVILKDKTELEANLVSVSNDHDLALLRIDGCKSPYMQSGAQNQLIQGMRVFTIGSPLGVGDSVSSGVISGYDNDYIRTDAKIYLGNSGGPLITADGKVIGINTLKLITQKFEGMGFAIPVRRAFREFNKYLKTNP
ncbi:MAG: trypsin-like peptidase domain-containing protein [Proteobacteria bacterium]|nr:trypsin-like peptidase domain-containing protein [Pseudomonadota bacterium]MBU2226736.1 trypsin-like peptidase domain-containing protein [Pseudomonadota bacterium]MBU2262892.1 trypsin-like peptidase domain-containing protein [Pseudomonadota bacterium]